MWKICFEIWNLCSYLIPTHRLRRAFQRDYLFDYRRKLNAIRANWPEYNWWHMTMKKGGGSLAFIFNGRTVFKVRKYTHRDDSASRFAYEKRLTDAIRSAVPVRIPQIDLVQMGEYLFYKTEFIPGRVLVDLPLKQIREHREKLGHQLAEIINSLFHFDAPELADLKPKNADKNDCGLVHGDMCSNIIVNPDTMDISGIIDWEYSGYGSLKREFFGIFWVRRKMRQTDIAPIAMWDYYQMQRKKQH